MVPQWISKAWSWSLQHFSGFPLLGPLAYCSARDHKAVIREMFIILLFGTATFWLTSALLMGYQATRSLGFLAVLQSTVRNGELFIFSVGFIGPILLIAAEDTLGERQFPGRIWHTCGLLVLALVATLYYTQIKSAQLQGKLVKEDVDFWFAISLVVAGFAIVLRYLAMVYKRSVFNPRTEIKGPEVGFLQGYAEHVKSEVKS